MPTTAAETRRASVQWRSETPGVCLLRWCKLSYNHCPLSPIMSTISGPDTVLKEADVAAFKQSLRGPLMAPGDDRYEEARQVWNGNIDRRPGLTAPPGWLTSSRPSTLPVTTTC